MSDYQPEPQSDKIIYIVDDISWTTAIIRQLLKHAFDDQGLTELVFDHFPDVHKEFGPEMTKGKKIQLLIEHCSRHHQGRRLITFIRTQYTTQYDSFLLSFRRETYKEVLRVPFVVVVMNQEEANQLSKNMDREYTNFAVFRTAFEKLRGELPDYYGSDDWVTNYAPDRDEWRPHIYRGMTINEIIEETAYYLNFERPGALSASSIVHPTSFTQYFFAAPEEEPERIWRELSKSGCILIIDPISLFHPNISSKVRDSNLSNNDRVAMLILSPVNFSAIQVNALLEKEIHNQFVVASGRIDKEWWDRLSDFGGGNLRTLKRWLYNTFLDAEKLITNKEMRSENKDILREKVGVSPNQANRSWPFTGNRQ